MGVNGIREHMVGASLQSDALPAILNLWLIKLNERLGNRLGGTIEAFAEAWCVVRQAHHEASDLVTSPIGKIAELGFLQSSSFLMVSLSNHARCICSRVQP